ncbi:hypothetical protein ACFX1S_007089 [Malus domestica]
MQPLHLTRFQRSKRQFQISKGICFFRRVSICHMQSKLYGNHRQFVEAPIPTICFSRRVNIYHMQSQLCGNHGQFVETPILDIEETLAFPDVSAPVTCTLSFTKITGNVSTISGEVEST